ncbi:PEP/pyruvate-binding domain-containing protein [Micromonospora sp. NPDC005553]|uniref:PEP/pyruvate-binding domain-containing protein n=1 Tax=unclassified Micromonospora TaxID=2617518 RepID=UPI0033B5C6FB
MTGGAGVAIGPGKALPIVQLSEAGDPSAYGGKAVKLGRLIQLGFPVPDGAALSASAAADIANNPKAVQNQTLSRLMEHLPIRDQSYPLVVRSSAVGEDGERTSCAGMYESVLGIDREHQELATAITDVVRSYDTPRAALYRRLTGIKPSSSGMAIVVQELVEARWSGVAHSSTIYRGMTAMVIEFGRGLGGGASDTADSNRYVIFRNAARARELVSGSEGAPVELLRSVEACVSEIEKLFGTAQDVEWAADDNQLWVIQSRRLVNSIW